MTKDVKRYRLHVIVLAVCASLGAGASGAVGSRDATGPEQQASRTARASNGADPSKQKVDHVPLKSGVWEQSILRGTQVVDGPVRQEQLCPGSLLFSPFPSLPSVENLGRVLPQELIMSDYVWRLADGRYRVTSGVT